MSESHLFRGFRFAGRLPSIEAQRNIQSSLISELIRDYQIGLFLSIGCAFGNELNEFYASCEHFRSLDVVAIDLADVNRELHSQAFARALGQRLEWEQLDLLDIRSLPRYGMFDIVQCGFVLHDICPPDKEQAYQVLADSVRLGGWLILSDMFPLFSDSPSGIAKEYVSEVKKLYESFIAEANSARERGILSADEWNALVGDGHSPGLKSNLHEALTGSRDFFETQSQTERRLVQAGLVIERVIQNPINSRLAVILASPARTLPL